MNYDDFLELLKNRRSIRRFKSDPVSDSQIARILDAAHYAMSGANSQPWEFIVVKDPAVRERLFQAYVRDFDTAWHLEQQRTAQYRHPAFNVTVEDKDKTLGMQANWREAPVVVVILEDPRKQWGSVMAAHGDLMYNSNRSILSATMGHVSMVIHLAAASLGLGTQRVDVTSNEQGYKEILGYPEPLRVNIIVPIGYRAYDPGPPHRLPIEDLVHYDRYDESKYLRDEDFLKYIEKIRVLGRPGYRVAIGEEPG